MRHRAGTMGCVGLALCVAVLVSTPIGSLQAQTPVAQARVADEGTSSEATVRLLSRVDRERAVANPDLPIVVQGVVRTREGNDPDAPTKPLPYTNIFVAGTDLGTMSVSEGRFWLRGLRPGTWTVKARYISYTEGSAEVDLRPGDLVEIEFVLSVDPIKFDPFQVRAERLLLARQETGTARRMSSDEIEALPIDDVVEMVALQPGVVLEDNQIHIRGGRSDDTSFLVDGIGVADPLAAGGYGVSINEDLINEIEVLTGGFSAEYGQAVSGVVNVSTKEGGERFEGKVTYKTDAVAPEANNYNTDSARLTLSGPNLLWDGAKAAGLGLPGEQSFIVSASSDLSDTYFPTSSLSGRLQSGVLESDFWSPRADNEWSVLGKLTWRVNPRRKLNFTHSAQQSVGLGFFLPSEGYPNKYQNILDQYNVFTSQSYLTQLSWREVLGEDSFYEINLGRQFSRLHSNKNGDDDFGTYTGPILNEIEIPSENDSVLVYVAGAHVGGDADRWHDHYTESWTAKADYAWIANEFNHFKAGIEYTYSEIQLVDLQGNLGSPPSGFLADSQDVFFAHPQVVAAYVQDRVEYKGLVLNGGLRLDGWAPGEEVDDVMSRPQDFVFIFDDMARSYEDKTWKVLGRRWKARLSPRVGLSLPISSRDKFFFNYGHFNQWPRYNYVYAQLQTDFSTRLRLLGNPDLDPKVTVQYETGLQHEFPNLWSAGITFYSNDIYDYAQSVRLEDVFVSPSETPDPTDTKTYQISPIRYFNSDAARSLGVEFHVEKRTTRWLSGRMSFELQRTTGTNSRADATFLAERLGQVSESYETEEGILNTPLLWDRPWAVTLNLDFYVDERDRPKPFGWKIPGNWSANLLVRAWAGARYTARILKDDGDVVDSRDTYGELGPYRSSLDVKLQRWWNLPGGQRLTLFFEGRNILDHMNYRRVNPWTGEGFYRGNWDGDLASQRINNPYRSAYDKQYVEDYLNPSYRTDPRRIMMGVSWKW